MDFQDKQSDNTGSRLKQNPKIEAQIRSTNNDLFTKRMLLFKVEWEFLNNQLRIELDKIKQDNQCGFQLSNDQNLRLDPILKFNGKQVILCGDLDGYKYEAQIVQIDECVMEPQLIYDVQINQYDEEIVQIDEGSKEPQLIKNEQSNIIQISTSLYGQATKAFEYFRLINKLIRHLRNISRTSQKMKFKLIFFTITFMELIDKGIIQVNLETNFQRKVYFKQFVNIPILDKDKFELKLEKSLGQQKYQVIIDIKSSQESKLDQIQKQIRDLLEKNQQKFNWKVKNFKDEDLIAIENTIRKRSIQFEGWIKQGNELQIKCFNKKAKKLQDYLNDIEKQFIIFPQGWIPQQQNLMKVKLNNYDEDYKKVQQLFHQSYPQGKLFQITRIQNKILYENFINEKRKLLQFKQLQGQDLNQAEQQTYLWHGVKSNHPSIIYDSIKEAFKNNYCSQNSYWGPGIYFAGQAIYSKAFAYKLTPQQSVDYPNKLIFLLCEVATGKCINLDPNNGIKEPPIGYDCVLGKQQGSDIYVLYGMDVRRAYPSFEIIFE